MGFTMEQAGAFPWDTLNPVSWILLMTDCRFAQHLTYLISSLFLFRRRKLREP